jgi:Ser/Thr protein kinase RdoA (MazF antagonist)
MARRRRNAPASVWGQEETRFFYQLSPEEILAAVEEAGLRTTGRVLALNSMENRVFEVEVDVDDPDALRDPSERYRVVKFYRPGRWDERQISAEHSFLAELAAAEIPVVPPIHFGGSTQHATPDGIIFAVFPKRGGRIPDELDTDLARRVGALIARVHTVGAARRAEERPMLNVATYGVANLEYLLRHDWLPVNWRQRYTEAVERIVAVADPVLSETAVHRIHGDCHLGNLLLGSRGLALVDFDDFVMGPSVQDIWLLTPARDREADRLREALLEGYESIRAFDRGTLVLTEALRALRYVHFSAWIARRWDDPAFPAAFPAFGDARWWAEQTIDLERQAELCERALG